MTATYVFGAVVSLLGVTGLFAGGWAVWKTAQQSAWQRAAEGWKALTEERDVEIADLRTELNRVEEEVKQLRVLAPPVRELVQTFRTEMQAHEAAAERRSRQLLTVLDMIAHRLGPDTSS